MEIQGLRSARRGSPSARERKRNRNTNCTFFCARPRKTPAIIHFFFLSIQERKERRPTTFAYRKTVSENDRGRRSHSLRIPTFFFVSGTKVKPWHPQPKKINETASDLLLISSPPPLLIQFLPSDFNRPFYYYCANFERDRNRLFPPRSIT